MTMTIGGVFRSLRSLGGMHACTCTTDDTLLYVCSLMNKYRTSCVWIVDKKTHLPTGMFRLYALHIIHEYIYIYICACYLLRACRFTVKQVYVCVGQ